MKLKSLLAGLLPGFIPFSASPSPSPSSHLGQVNINYNQFQDQTEVSVVGVQLANQPILFVSDQFKGKKPDVSELIKVGFLIKPEDYESSCDVPNFLANGSRVSDVADTWGSKSSYTIPRFQNLTTTDGKQVSYTFFYNVYYPRQVAQIARAKHVQYELCNHGYSLPPQDQAYLQQMLLNYRNVLPH